MYFFIHVVWLRVLMTKKKYECRVENENCWIDWLLDIIQSISSTRNETVKGQNEINMAGITLLFGLHNNALKTRTDMGIFRETARTNIENVSKRFERNSFIMLLLESSSFFKNASQHVLNTA